MPGVPGVDESKEEDIPDEDKYDEDAELDATKKVTRSVQHTLLELRI